MKRFIYPVFAAVNNARRIEAIVSDRSAPQKHVWRANIILATAEGCGTAEITSPPPSNTRRKASPKTLVPRPPERRMIGDLVLNAQLAKPPIGQIDLHLSAEPPLRADREHIAHNQHPDHQHRIDRGAASVRVVGRKLLVHPTEIENAVDLADQMIGWHHLCRDQRNKTTGLVRLPADPS
jgi:hypothetical protein